MFGPRQYPEACTSVKCWAACSMVDSVLVMFPTRLGLACHRRATPPATCGAAMDVPDQPEPYPFVGTAPRIFTPGAERSGLVRRLPSTVTGPRLLKLAILLPESRAPTSTELA